MNNSKFEQALDKQLEKYFPEEVEEQVPTGNKTEQMLEQEMSLFGDTGKKETFAQKAARLGAKAVTKPAAMASSISRFAKAQEQGGTLGALAQTDWFQKRSQDPNQQQKNLGGNAKISPTTDPAAFQANIKQQWRQLPPDVQRAYGTEAAYLNIKTQEATHLKR